MNGLLLAAGLLVGVVWVLRLVETGGRALPLVALAVGLLAVATPPGQDLRELLGGGLLVVVRLVAWALAPLVALVLLVVAMLWLGREPRRAGSRGRVGTVVLTLLLGLLGGLLLAQLPATPAVGRGLGAVAGAVGSSLWEAAVVLLGGLENVEVG